MVTSAHDGLLARIMGGIAKSLFGKVAHIQDESNPYSRWKYYAVSPLTVLVDMTLRHHMSIRRNMLQERYVLSP